MSGGSRERSEDVSSLGKKSDGEALRSIIHKLSDYRNLRDLQQKHYHMSTAHFKKKTTHLDMPGKVYDLYQHVVKTCQFCNSTKPRLDRSRVSGFESRRIWRSYLFGPLIDQHCRHNFWISDWFKWSDITCKSTSPSEVRSKLREWMDTFQMNRMAICAIWLSIILMACKHSIECIM